MAALGLILLVLAGLIIRVNAVVILLGGLAYIHLVWGDGHLEYLVEDMWISLDNDLLLAIPMFLIAGNIMTRGSIAKRLIRVTTLLTDPLPGGMGVATILSCAIFAAISGSSPVTLLAVGSVLYPALREAGYSKSFSLGAITSGGTLGIIIPPSIPLIVYGLVTEKSIADLFIAGMIPGLLMVGALGFYSFWINRHLPSKPFDFPALILALKEGIWSLMLPVILLAGIYSGYFSPTEAAAVALAYGLFVEAFIHRELGIRDFFRTTVDTAVMLGMLFPIIAVALSLNTVLTIERVPHSLADWVVSVTDSKIAFLLAVNLLLLLAGCLIDAVSAILILGPLLLAPAMAYGIDPIHFGVMMVINLEVGFLTPPIGLNLFVAMSAFRVTFLEVARAVLPFVLIIFGVLMLVTFIPGISLALLR
ncbi:TRAP transporter large permease [Chachezhania sediminis]|uniref:TRAP transporter large permease n=1 Tax=Chachezhania sediminis TaxID=2599291 RepID=UPI001E4F6F49|nr:TRAP transporter large permease subunit [Chachezhania sediminis]